MCTSHLQIDTVVWGVPRPEVGVDDLLGPEVAGEGGGHESARPLGQRVVVQHRDHATVPGGHADLQVALRQVHGAPQGHLDARVGQQNALLHQNPLSLDWGDEDEKSSGDDGQRNSRGSATTTTTITTTPAAQTTAVTCQRVCRV